MSIVVCGNVVCDILARPVDEVRYGATTLVENVERQLGGNGGSTSFTVAKLGCPIALATLIGRDENARFVLDHLRSAGVRLDLVQTVEAPTSVAVALIKRDGERALLYQLGAASRDFRNFEFPEGSKHFHLAAVYRMRHLREAAPALLRQARESGLKTSLDTQWDTEGEWMKVLAPSLPYVDYTMVNEDEARMLTGSSEPSTAAVCLRDHGATNIVIKLGAKGCWMNGLHIPGYEVDAIDTTGAGDCFVGGFLAALHRGMTPDRAAAVANAVGALSVQKLGATAGVPGWDSTMAWMAAQHPAAQE